MSLPPLVNVSLIDDGELARGVLDDHTGEPSLYSGGIGNLHPQVVGDVLARWTRLPIPLVDLFILLAVLYPRRPRVPERE